MIRIDPLLTYVTVVVVAVTGIFVVGAAGAWLARKGSVPLRHGIAVTTLALVVATPWLVAFGGHLPGVGHRGLPFVAIIAPLAPTDDEPPPAEATTDRIVATTEANVLLESTAPSDSAPLAETGAISDSRTSANRATRDDARSPAAASLARSSPMTTSTLPDESSHHTEDSRRSARAEPITIPHELGWSLALLWSAGCAWRGLVLARGLRTIARLRRRLGIARPSTRRLAIDIADRMRMRRAPAVRTSRDIPVPLSTGIVSPVVVIPCDVEAAADPDTLRDLLVHETAHIAHRDVVVGVLQRVADIVFWFHPLLPRLQRGIERLREERCDTWVLRFQASPRLYAATLLRLAERAIRPPALPATVGLLSGRGSFETRVASLLQEDRDMTTTLHPLGRSALVGVAALAFVALASLDLSHARLPSSNVTGPEPPAALANDGDVTDGNPPEGTVVADAFALEPGEPNGVLRGTVIDAREPAEPKAPPIPLPKRTAFPTTDRPLDARVEAAVDNAIAWLVENQLHDGSWREHDSYFGGDVGTTALAARALLHASPNDRELAIAASTAVSRAVTWLVDRQRNSASGNDLFFGTGREPTFFYGQALATLFLADAYCLTNDESMHEALERAVKGMLAAQNPYKGWRYGVRTGDNDTSATGQALVALDAARRAGFDVPDERIRHGLSWFDDVTESSDGLVGFTGRGYYETSFPGRNDAYAEHPTMTAIAALARDLHDRAKYRQAIGLALSHLLADPPRDAGATPSDVEIAAPIDPIDPAEADFEDPASPPRPKNGLTRDYYYWHWGTAAMYRANGPTGDAWRTWSTSTVETILGLQLREGSERGSWPVEARWAVAAGPVYATAINVLTLRTPSIVPLPR